MIFILGVLMLQTTATAGGCHPDKGMVCPPEDEEEDEEAEAGEPQPTIATPAVPPGNTAPPFDVAACHEKCTSAPNPRYCRLSCPMTSPSPTPDVAEQGRGAETAMETPPVETPMAMPTEMPAEMAEVASEESAEEGTEADAGEDVFLMILELMMPPPQAAPVAMGFPEPANPRLQILSLLLELLLAKQGI